MADSEALSGETTEANVEMQIENNEQNNGSDNEPNNEQKNDEKNIDLDEVYSNEDVIFRKKGEPIDVGLYTYVYRIDNINLVDQSFDALFYCTFSWKPTKKEWELYQNDPLGYVPEWIPSVHIPNGANIVKKVVKGDKNSGYRIARTGLNLQEHPFGRKIGKPKTSDNNGYNLYNCFQYSIECSINERYELENFPFDCQELKIIVEGSARNDVYVLRPSLIDEYKSMGGLSIKFSNAQEYDVYQPLNEFKTTVYGIDHYPLHVYNIKLKRRYWVYLFKYFLFNFIITAGSLFVFSELVQEKLDYLVTLLLTQVAYQFVLTTSLPNLPYLTILDKYVSFGFIYIFLIMVFILSFSAAYDIEEEASKFQYALYILIGIFIIFHIYIAIVIILALKYETKKLDLSTIQLANAGYEDNTEPETFITDEIHTIISESTLNFMKNKNGMELLSKTDDG
mmetsp:Transcript_22974/g.28213  ORF Transcript_22974/g.28213 Transcript_22974/m.28213 type:complete len:452 (-) Transcript_22974:108-1463(-)